MRLDHIASLAVAAAAATLSVNHGHAVDLPFASGPHGGRGDRERRAAARAKAPAAARVDRGGGVMASDAMLELEAWLRGALRSFVSEEEPTCIVHGDFRLAAG